MPGKLSLHYFDARARAEPIRLTLAAAKVDFDDVRFSREEWPKLKTSQAPSGVAPWLVTPDGKKLVQSGAIVRYLAKQYKLAGNSDWEFYLVERALAQIDDLTNELLKAFMAPDDKKAELGKEFQSGKGLSLLTNLVAFLKDGGSGGLFVPSGLTVADLACLHVVEWVGGAFPELVGKFPQLKAHTEKVKAVSPPVANWLKKRPKTAF